jgi:hypothetical protein
MSVHDQETSGLIDEERIDLRDQLARRLVSPGAEATLSDDIGTTYSSCGGGCHGGSQEKIGRTDFVPAVPEEATALIVHWGDLKFPVPLT